MVKLLGKEIKPVPVAKDVGVIIDSSLSYNEHVTKTVSHCMHRLSRINRIYSLRSKRFLASSSRKLGGEQIKKRNDGGGGGE